MSTDDLHDIAAERIVLGSMMLDADVTASVTEHVKTGDFYKPAHGTIFAAITGLQGRDAPVEPVAVADELAESGDLTRVGGPVYLYELFHGVDHAGSAGYYAQIVAEHAAKREALNTLTRLADAFRQGNVDSLDAVREHLAGHFAAPWIQETRTRRAENAGWTTPEPALTPPLPDFPTKLLPPVLRDMAEAASAEVQTPVGMAAMLSLAIAASTVAGKIEVAGRPGHVEQLPLWVFVAAKSAERKTPVFNLLRAPLIAYEQEHQRANGLERKQAQFKAKVLEGRIGALQKKAVRDSSANVMAEVDAALAELEDLRVPARMQLWVSSPTPEAVHNLLAEHDGRMAAFSDEGGLFGIIAGRYAGKSGGADIDPFLSGYVGSPLRAPRVTAERKNVEAAFLTMGFAVQPSVLADLGGVAGAEDRGLIGRFLFGLPDSMVGDRPYGGSVASPEAVKEAYAAAMTRWARFSVPSERRQLLLDPDAYREYAAFHDRIEARNKEGGDLHPIGSWGGKIAGTALRIAALLHLFEHGDDGGVLDRAIGVETIRSAAVMTEEFFIPHAFAAFKVLRHGGAKSVKHRLLSWIASKQLKEFTLREALRHLGGGGATVHANADVEPALAELVGSGYVRLAKSRRADSVKYEVNPLWDFR